MADRLLDRLLAQSGPIARDVAADLGAGADPATVEPLVRRHLGALAAERRLVPAELARLRADGAAAARAGVPLAGPLDTYLSTGWVAWDHAVRLARADEADELALLGSTLLRAGDDLAAALAEGYVSAERALAARAGATRRAVLDELLAPPSPGAAAQARLLHRATLAGLDPALPYGLAVVRAVTELEEEGAAVEETARRLARDPARRPHLVSVRDGDLVLLVAGPWRSAAVLERALDGVIADAWWAASVSPDALLTLPRAHAAALDALRVLPACRPAGTLTPAGDVALERALVADPVLAGEGVHRWLGPLEAGGRGSVALVPTLEAWLASGGSVTGTARRLAVAPRTVTYRLGRIAHLLGRSTLDADARERLSAAVLARRLLDAWVDPAALLRSMR